MVTYKLTEYFDFLIIIGINLVLDAGGLVQFAHHNA
jgi:hypothetical protein